MSLLRCFDGVTFDAIPKGDLVLGYVDGKYQTWHDLNERFKDSGTVVLSVTVDVRPGADIADCERGNAGPDAVAQWAKVELRQRRRPTIYGSRDYLVACSNALRKLRVNPVLVDFFLADYVQVTPAFDTVKWPTSLPEGYVAWQFANSIPVNGHTIDASVVDPHYAKSHGFDRRRTVTKLPTAQPRTPVRAHQPTDTFIGAPGWYGIENGKIERVR